MVTELWVLFHCRNALLRTARLQSHYATLSQLEQSAAAATRQLALSPT